MTEEGTEVRFNPKRLDQLAGEVRNWLLDRVRDAHDARPWDQRPEEDQHVAINQAEATAINLVSDIADAMRDDGKQVIRAQMGKVVFDGDVLKADVSLLAEGSEDDVHAMVDAAGKKVLVVVSDPTGYLGVEDRPEVEQDQGSLGLENPDHEQFDRIYLLYDQAECREEHLPNDEWPFAQPSVVNGATWVTEAPVPTEKRRFVLEAKRSFDRDEAGEVATLGAWEPPHVTGELMLPSEDPTVERLLCRYKMDALPKKHWPKKAWLFGLGGDASGVEWFVQDEFPGTNPEMPYGFEAMRGLDGDKLPTQGEKVAAEWSDPTVFEIHVADEGGGGDAQAGD